MPSFWEEVQAVVDPSRRASESTETALRVTSAPGAPNVALASVATDQSDLPQADLSDVGTLSELSFAAGAPAVAAGNFASTGDVDAGASEAIGRQFDAEPGGGFVDEAGRQAPFVPQGPPNLEAPDLEVPNLPDGQDLGNVATLLKAVVVVVVLGLLVQLFAPLLDDGGGS